MIKMLRVRPTRVVWLGLLFLSLFHSVSVTSAQAAPVGSSVWVVPIDSEITPATAQFVERRIEEANDAQPLALVFLINTPGGRIDAAQRISDAILQRATVPTFAVVESALSAGALIAMSTEQIAMLPGSEIGAATVINGLTGQQASEKINSAWRGIFRATAEARGRNAEVAEGMVDTRVEIPGLSTNEELVTLSAAQAVEYNIANIQARSLGDALDGFGYGGATIQRLEPTLSERVAGSLTSPLVAALLLAVGLGGILIEIFTPGFGLPGGIGALALALFFGGAFIATPAGPLDLVLLLAGVLLLAAEVLVIPGFGVAGVLGLAAIIFAIFRIFEERSISVLSYTTLFAAALLGLAFWLFPNKRFGGFLTLSTRLSSELNADLGGAHASNNLYDLVNQEGVATSDLRPAGVARFGEARVDVVTEGDFIGSGTPVRVLRVEGNRVTVRAVEV